MNYSDHARQRRVQHDVKNAVWPSDEDDDTPE